MSTLTSENLAKRIAEILDSKKGRDIQTINIEKKTIIADYFVICSGTSTTQVKGLADEVAFQLKQQGREPARTEGYESGSWILLDYLDVVVHVFLQSEREFYSLDKLWQA
ncbi:MAG: ribosome silencing factor [Ruminococcaceae bacterium]|jgi:ribosome-associated protein|nr:ribosome silencing factor [Oscillospiraceae bacterium]